MNRYAFFGILAALIDVLSGAFYVIAILRGFTKPSRVTFWIWLVLSTLIMASYVKSGGTTLWLQAMYVMSPLIIATLSLWYGEGSAPTRLEKSVLGIAFVSIPLWVVLKAIWGDVPEAALPILLLNIGANAVGGIPTFEKAWNRPETENATAWVLCVAASLVNLLAVRSWGAADVIWNGYMTSAATFIALCACFRPSSVALTPVR